MNNVDIADQLCGVYHFYHWMRKIKWWWAIWFWEFQTLLTNYYIFYCKYMKMHDHEQDIMTQYEFKTAIALAWMYPNNYWPKCPSECVSSSSSTVNSTSTSAAVVTQSARKLDIDQNKRKQDTKFTDHTLCPASGVL
mmetsp:Transcript_13416/g.19351  ORF Transcript_13416/g.19351 Transcript_13416/m.19351 type:complete len:137 (-) Transcript_13416:377-787(-)